MSDLYVCKHTVCIILYYIVLNNSVKVCGADLNFEYVSNIYSFVTHLLTSNINVQESH